MKVEETAQLDLDYLNLAQKSAKLENWLDVFYYLQQLPFWGDKQSLASLEPGIKSQLIELGILILLRGDFQQKWQIAKILPLMSPEIITPLVGLLQSQNIEIETKWFVANILGKLQSQKAVITLAKLVQSAEDSDLIAAAAKSLTQIGEMAVSTLTDLLEDSNHRLIAAKSLAHIRLASTLPALLELAEDVDPQVRLLAIEALGSFHQPQVPPVLFKALADTSSLVRKEAVIGLGFCGSFCQESSLVAELKPLLYDLNLDVCRQATISLSKLKSESANKVLDEALQSEHTPLSLKLDLARSLAWSEVDTALDYLEVAFEQQNTVLSQEIITVLGRISSEKLKPKAIAILCNFWRTRNPNDLDLATKKALATALGELNARDAKDILEQLTQDQDNMLKLYAASSLRKITS